jgi:hypothetical protein
MSGGTATMSAPAPVKFSSQIQEISGGDADLGAMLTQAEKELNSHRMDSFYAVYGDREEILKGYDAYRKTAQKGKEIFSYFVAKTVNIGF